MIVLRNITDYKNDKKLFEFIIKIYPKLNIKDVNIQIRNFLFFKYEYLVINKTDICSYKTKIQVKENIKTEYNIHYLSDFIILLHKMMEFSNNSVIIKIKNDDLFNLILLLKIKYKTSKYDYNIPYNYDDFDNKYIMVNEKYCSDILYDEIFEDIRNNYKIIDSDVYIRNEKLNNLFKNDLK